MSSSAPGAIQTLPQLASPTPEVKRVTAGDLSGLSPWLLAPNLQVLVMLGLQRVGRVVTAGPAATVAQPT